MNNNLNLRLYNLPRTKTQTTIATAPIVERKSVKKNTGILHAIVLGILIVVASSSNANNFRGPYGSTLKASGSSLIAPAFEDIVVYRLQLRIYTCNNEDAGTDDDVYVQMNSGDDKFYLDKSNNDFVKGRDSKYDILSKSIKQIRDIKFLKLGIRGSDATCFRRIQIIVNNNNDHPIFEKSYSGHGRWIDDNESFVISQTELRTYSGWKYTSGNVDLWKPPSKKLSKNLILSVVECSIGNQLNYQSEVSWGSKEWGLPNTLFGPGVEVSYVNKKTLHFDLDLQGKMLGPNPEVDVDFDLEFSCKDGRIVTEIKNLKFKGEGNIFALQNWVREKGSILLGTAIGTQLGSPQTGAVVGGFVAKYLSLSIDLNLNDPVITVPCGSIEVLPECNVIIRNN